MFLAKVRGTVVSTSKDARLVGCKLLVTQRLGIDGEFVGQPEVSIDTVGAGVGETVIITKGSSARYTSNNPNAASSPIDATIVGIVDQIEIER
ncbi:MAG: EutN/CcmL family microcompartment protein [Propionibacteriaceae bacterium]|jgi:ethanolamine utilization protein EutN|nr:EutN/CcmL family microcompartment protein [Propionibacteriaceae bacterium]